jgi:high-affinity Fe2+/Pb2+ permease
MIWLGLIIGLAIGFTAGMYFFVWMLKLGFEDNDAA